MMTLELTKGTKLLCYDPANAFDLGEEYKISYVGTNGFLIRNNYGKNILFETITDIKNTFMIE